MFAVIAITIWASAHAYVAWSVGRHIDRRALRWTVWGLLGLDFAAAVAAFSLRRSFPEAALVGALQWVAYVGMGAFVLLWVLVLLRDLVTLAVAVVRRGRRALAAGESADDAPADPGRRELFRGAVNSSLLGVAAVGTAYGFRQARKIPDVVEVDVPVEGLAAGLDGFRIAQISDVHVGPTIKRPFLQAVVDRVNELEADLVAFTGDMVDGYVEHMSDQVAPIRELRAPHGVYFVTGNHEYYWDAPAWCDEVARCGLTVLNNAHKLVEVDGARLIVGGVTDHNAERHIPEQASDPHEAMAGAPDADFRLLMAHQPKSVWKAAEAGWDLQLSGHTHGGQFWPWTLLVGLAHPFTQGLHDYEDMQIYVSCGTGYWGPPLRIGVPSEITLLTLRRV